MYDPVKFIYSVWILWIVVGISDCIAWGTPTLNTPVISTRLFHHHKYACIPDFFTRIDTVLCLRLLAKPWLQWKLKHGTRSDRWTDSAAFAIFTIDKSTLSSVICVPSVSAYIYTKPAMANLISTVMSKSPFLNKSMRFQDSMFF